MKDSEQVALRGVRKGVGAWPTDAGVINWGAEVQASDLGSALE